MSQTEAAVRKEVSEQTDDILVSMKGIVKQYHVGGEISTVLKGIDLTVRKGGIPRHSRPLRIGGNRH